MLRLGVIFTALTISFDAMFGVRGLMWVQAVTDTAACVLAAFMYEQFKRSIFREFTLETATPSAVIGRQVAEALGIPCYDGEMIGRIAEESGLAKEYVASKDESVSVMDLYDSTEGAMTDKMWFAQKKVITGLAEKGACVIVGRCADHILRGSADCLTVFVHASD